MTEQITKVLTASGDIAIERVGYRIHITDVIVSNVTGTLTVQIRQTDGTGTILSEFDVGASGVVHIPFRKPLEGLVYNGSGQGDMYCTISGGGTPKVSFIGSYGKPHV